MTAPFELFQMKSPLLEEVLHNSLAGTTSNGSKPFRLEN